MGKTGLGKSLLRRKRLNRNVSSRHTMSGEPSVSVTETTSVEEFMANAEAAQREFKAERGVSKIMNALPEGESVKEKPDRMESEHYERPEFFSIPKKPDHAGCSEEEFKLLETRSFLDWKKSLNALQYKYPNLPLFEKNLDFWRQLWKILEISDVLVQVVDARNPLFYQSLDLSSYVQEIAAKADIKKYNVLLLNKADFLTLRQREIWADFFRGGDTLTAFFSAVETSEDELEDLDFVDFNTPEILSPSRILNLFKTLGGDPITVGFVGYPNVGKSSTINRFIDTRKRIQVSATPGKTKHYQTHILQEGKIILVDGPGLVIPSLNMTKAEMVLGGILPIDNLTEYMSCVEALLKRCSFGEIARHYGIMEKKILQAAASDRAETQAHKFLASFGLMRGFMKPGGIPDTARAARFVLKDFALGKLLHCVGPPNSDPEEFKPPVEDEELKLAMERAEDLSIKESFPEISKQFGVHIRGNQPLAHKKYKKVHGNKNKREKARRVYKDSSY